MDTHDAVISMHTTKHTTKVFLNGIRRPCESDRTDMVMHNERVGDELRIRPARRSLSGLMERFARFATDFMANGRGEHDQRERDAL